MKNTRLALRYTVRHFVKELPFVAARCEVLRSREREDPAQAALRQQARLRHTLECAANRLPAYAHLRGKVPASGVVDFLRTLPIVDKNTLLGDRERHYPNRGHARPWWASGKTSGTTGTPLDVFRSYNSTLWEQVFMRQHWSWAGWLPGDRQAVLRGDLVVPVAQAAPPYWFHDRVGEQLFLSTRHLKTNSVHAIAKAIMEYRPVLMRAYPSAVYNLALLLKENHLQVQVRSVITGSEHLLPVQRQLIETTLNARIFDFYGMAERVAFAMECEHGSLHVQPEYSFVEIVDEHGQPTDGPGYIVGTTFHNDVMPLVRYRLSDMAQWSDQPCPCGRTYPYLRSIGGKFEDQLFDRDCNAVNASVVTFAFKGVTKIAKAQVAQVGADSWVIRLVPFPGFGEAQQRLLLENFRALVSERIEVSIALCEDIPAQKSGKYKWVSQEYYVGERRPGIH
jgi:phenylacetate-CoA ligase